MQNSKMILTEAVSPPMPLEKSTRSSMAGITSKAETENDAEGISGSRRIQAARDFESLLLSRLLNEMKDTIGEWGFRKDGVSRQIRGIFWNYLARDISDKGGLGLWKQISESINVAGKPNIRGEALDSKL